MPSLQEVGDAAASWAVAAAVSAWAFGTVRLAPVNLALRGQSLATEAAISVREAARTAGVPYLVAIVRPENLPSQRVAENIGLRLERRAFKNGGDALAFGAEL